MRTATARVPTPDSEVWLSVHDASAMLGVSPATLRRWSVAGEIEAFTTPGGHRRFALSTLRALLRLSSQTPVRLAALGESSERLVKVIRRHARSASGNCSWLRGVADENRETLREQSRAMVQGLVGYLDAATPDAQDAALSDAETAARVVGAMSAAHGGELVESFGVFLRFRSLVMRELCSLAVRRSLSTPEATTLLTRGGEAVDRMLAAMVDAHAAA